MRNTLSSSFKFLFRPALVFLLSILFFSCARLNPPGTVLIQEVPALNPLNDWLYRGGQPKEEDFATLKQKGIRTIVNFRDEPRWIEWEKEKVEALGMKYVSLPWNLTRSVKPELLDQFFEVLDNPRNRPVLFHCKYGRDRSGVMSTLALMRYEKMSEPEARGLALETILPHRRYRYFVNKKIEFFLKERASEFSESSVPDHKTPSPAAKENVSSPTA